MMPIEHAAIEHYPGRAPVKQNELGTRIEQLQLEQSREPRWRVRMYDADSLEEGITVVTLARNEPRRLQKAISSVTNQQISAAKHHLVMIDDCPATLEYLSSLRPAVTWYYATRLPSDRTGVPRVAVLRNLALSLVRTRWVSFLDQDNTFYPNHLERLHSLARHSNSLAVHSWRRLFWRDGRPFTEAYDPWTRNEWDRRSVYEQRRRLGIYLAGSNVLRDTLGDCSSELYNIDMNEWLIATELARSVGFKVQYSRDEWVTNRPEDWHFARDVYQAYSKIICTQEATLDYFLGGLSNEFATTDVSAEDLQWQKPDQ
jgi:glycosyltransferase involved in cell wall biosynthesis